MCGRCRIPKYEQNSLTEIELLRTKEEADRVLTRTGCTKIPHGSSGNKSGYEATAIQMDPFLLVSAFEVRNVGYCVLINSLDFFVCISPSDEIPAGCDNHTETRSPPDHLLCRTGPSGHELAFKP